MELEVSATADWAFFQKLADILEQGLGGSWVQKLDGLDERYWDLAVGEQMLTLHLQHYLGIFVLLPACSDATVAQVRMLLELESG
jgi:hypothetical protein